MASTFEALLLSQVGYVQNNLPQLLATVTLAATTATVSYTVVTPYNRLWCAWRAMCTAAATTETLEGQFNGVTTSSYLWQDIQGTNSSANSNSSGAASSFIALGNLPGTSATANYFASGSFIVDGANQAVSYMTVQGTATAFVSTASSVTGAYGGQYMGAGPLTSLLLQPASGSFAAGSQFSFYGLG